MKTSFNYLFALTVFMLSYNPSNAQDNWVKKANFDGMSRNFGTAFCIDGRGYFGTGEYFSNSPVYYNDLWQYNPITNSWVQKDSLGFYGRAGAVGFSIGDKGYIGTGWTPGNDFWVYDSLNNIWSPIASLPAAGRIGGIAFSIGNKGYTGLGKDINGNYLKDFWQYDTALDQWIQKADYPGAGYFAAIGFNIGNKGFVGSGQDANGLSHKDFWEYDPINDKWTQKANIGGGVRKGGVGFCLGNMGYVGFGQLSGVVSNDMWAYDSTLNHWTQMSSCDSSYTAYAPSVFVIGNRAYVCCGVDKRNKFRTDVWQYSNHTSDIKLPVQPIEVVVYPNPNSGNFTVKGIPNSGYFEICDIQGRVIYQSAKSSSSSTINLGLKLSDGFYFIRLMSDDGIDVKKFVVKR